MLERYSLQNILYRQPYIVSLFVFHKCTYCKSLWTKASAKCECLIGVCVGRHCQYVMYLQPLDLGPLVLQLGVQLPDLGLLPADQRLVHHGLLLELKLAMQRVDLWEGRRPHGETTDRRRTGLGSCLM